MRHYAAASRQVARPECNAERSATRNVGAAACVDVHRARIPAVADIAAARRVRDDALAYFDPDVRPATAREIRRIRREPARVQIAAATRPYARRAGTAREADIGAARGLNFERSDGHVERHVGAARGRELELVAG